MTKRIYHYRLLAFTLLLIIFARANATEYQFGGDYIDLGGDPLFHGTTHVFLWVPPHAQNLRAVVLAPANIIERRVADDPIIRAEATRDSFAIFFFHASWAKGAMNSPNIANYVQDMLTRLAAQSGYTELSTIPWIPLGHSGNSQFVQAIARQTSGNVLAEILIKGAIPAVGKDGSTAGLKDIPHYRLAVRTTAYQWGKGTEPMVQTATPVTQTFYIKAPRKH